MSKLLEIFGSAISVDTVELIWHWLNTVNFYNGSRPEQSKQLGTILEMIADKKIDRATEQLRIYLFENPSCVLGRLAAAAICISENKLDNAIDELKSVYRKQPNNTMTLYALGHCFERLGNESEAVQFYQDCLKFKNHLQLPRQRLAAICFKNSQLEKTTTEYELLKEEYPDDISNLITLGHLYIACGQFSKAVETFNNAILIHPDGFNDGFEQIDQLIGAGELDEALQQLDDLLATYPERPELMSKKADVLAMLGATADAIWHYKKSLGLCPELLEVTIKLATLYLQSDNPGLAAQQFNTAAEINDRIVDAYTGLAIAQKASNDTSNALTTLSLAAAIAQNTPLLFAQTALLQFETGKGPFLTDTYVSTEADSSENILKVINAHRSQICSRPQNPELFYRLGILMMSVNDLNGAIEAFGRAVELNPTYSRARTKLAVCLYEDGQHKQALKCLTSPDCLDKATLELHYKTALLYCDKIKFASSLMNLYNAMNTNFTSADSTVNISIVLQNLGLLDRASVMWDNLYETLQHTPD